MMNYILHSSILIGLCYLFYQMFLKKETFFFFNRWLLLSFLPIAFLLPFLEVPQEWSLKEKYIAENSKTDFSEIIPLTVESEFEISTVNDEVKPENAPTHFVEDASSVQPIDLEKNVNESISIVSWVENLSFLYFLKIIYLIGLAFFAFIFLFRFCGLVFKIISHPKIRKRGYKIIETNQNIAPCSFGNFIFINPNKYDPIIYGQIIQHEKIHIAEWHTLDILLSEILTAFQWFNPFSWLYRKAVENNLEYLTDQLMLTNGTDRQAYQLSLLKVSVPHFSPKLATNYNQSFLKKRIIMMNAKKSPLRSGWKYLLVLPILGLSVICLNTVKSVANGQSGLNFEFFDLTEWQETDQKNNEENVEKNVDEKDVKIIEQQASENEIEIETELENENGSAYKIIHYGAFFSITGEWEAAIKGDKVCLTYLKKGRYYSMTWGDERCIDKSEFSNIPTGSESEFTLTRDAGTFTFNGKFEDGKGTGKYSFEADPAFESYLNNEGISSVSEESLFHACINNVGKNYVTEIKHLGFKMDSDDFEALAHFATPIEEIKNYNRDLKKIGYNDFSLKDIALLEIHGVSLEYIKEMHELGFKDLTIEKMVQASIHNVTPDYFRELKAAGLEHIEFRDLIQFAIHNIEPEYVKEMQGMSSRKLTNKEIIQAGIHNVDSEYFDELKEAGMEDMEFKELIQFSIHNISPEYVKEMQGISSRKLSSKEIVQAGIHNVSSEYFDELKEAGMEDMEFKELIQFSIHNISPKYIKEMQGIGSRKLSSKEIVQAGIHNVDSDYFDELKEAGMEDMEFKELIQFSIHNISPKYIKEMQNLSSRKLTSKEIVQAGIHNVSSEYFKELKEAGMEDMEFEELIQFSIHNVRPKFIKEIKALGYNDISSDAIIKARIHGVTPNYIISLQEVGIKNEPIRKLIEACIHGISASYIKKVNAETDKKDMTLDDYIDRKIMGRRSH